MHYVILCKTTRFVKSLSENHLYPVKIFAFFSNLHLGYCGYFCHSVTGKISHQNISAEQVLGSMFLGQLSWFPNTFKDHLDWNVPIASYAYVIEKKMQVCPLRNIINR